MLEKKIIVISDPHLSVQSGDVEDMIDFINTLDPRIHEILFLGDLFHIWAGPEKYHTSSVKMMMSCLKKYQQQQGKTHLVVGNRDIFFKERTHTDKPDHLPFTSISKDFLVLKRQDKTLVATHGDTINSLDKRYLKWRKLVRHPLFRLLFNLMPVWWVKKTMFKLETEIQNTNIEFRHEFPTEEWQQFLQSVYTEFFPHLLLAGHFHPKDPIINHYKSTTGVIVPDWNREFSYLEIDSQLEYQLCHYSSMNRQKQLS